jgi:hypothetical protein
VFDFDGHRASAARSELAQDLTKPMLRLTPFISLNLLDGRELSASSTSSSTSPRPPSADLLGGVSVDGPPPQPATLL